MIPRFEASKPHRWTIDLVDAVDREGDEGQNEMLGGGLGAESEEFVGRVARRVEQRACWRGEWGRWRGRTGEDEEGKDEGRGGRKRSSNRGGRDAVAAGVVSETM